LIERWDDRDEEVTERSKGYLTIIVKEIKDIIEKYSEKEATEKINTLLDGWVKQSNLHLERVKNDKGIYVYSKDTEYELEVNK